MSRYTSATDADRAEMLAKIGVERIDDLFADIPEDVRPLRAGDRGLDRAALGVPHSLHALSARDLSGHAAGDVRVPDGDLGADRAASLERISLRGAVVGRGGGLPRQ